MSEKLKRMIERMKVQRVLGSLKMCCANIHSNHGVDHLSSGGVTHPRRSRVASTSWFYASLFSIVMLLVPTGLTSLTKTGWRWVLRRPGTEWSTTLSQWRRSWLVYHLQPVARIVIGPKEETEQYGCISSDKQWDFDVWCVLDVASMLERWFSYDWTAVNWRIVQGLTPPLLRDSWERVQQTPLPWVQEKLIHWWMAYGTFTCPLSFLIVRPQCLTN